MLNKGAETTLAVGGLIKTAIMSLGSLAIFALAIWGFIQGDWVFGLLLIFIAQPIWLFVADILTGLVLLPIVGLAAGAAAVRNRGS